MMTENGNPSQGRRPLTSALLAALVVAGGSLPVYLTGALFIQLSEDLAFGAAGLGVIVGAYRGAIALAAVPLGRLADRVQPERSLRLSLLLAAVTMAGIASLSRSSVDLFFFLLMAGVAYALGQTAVNVFLATSVPASRQGMALGVKQAAIPMSGTLAGLAVPVLALTLGWRSAFWLFALLSIVGVFAIPNNGPKFTAPLKATKVSRRMSTRATITLGVALGFGIAANATGTAFLVDSSVRAGIGVGAAGLLLAVSSAASIAMRVISGVFVDRLQIDPLRVTLAMLALGATGYFGMATGPQPIFVVGAFIALTLGWGYNGVFWLAVVRHSPGSTGASTGVILPLGMTGGVLGPFIAGRLIEATNYSLVWGIVGLWLMISVGFVVLGVQLLKADVPRE